MNQNLKSLTRACAVGGVLMTVLLSLNLVSAASVKLSAPLNWEINGGDITIYAGAVNNTGSAISGDLRLEVWAFTSPYNGKYQDGYMLGAYDVGQLAGKHAIRNIAATVPYTAPSTYNNDAYYTTIFLYEYKNNSWVVDSYITFKSTVPLDSGYQGGLAQAAVGRLIQYVGEVSYDVVGNEVTLTANEIENANSSYKVTGTLKMQLWATSTPYTGGTIYGYVLGEYAIGQLVHGGDYFNLNNTVPYYAPPYGTYYLTMTLNMYTSSGYKIMNYINFSGQQTF